MKEIENYVSTKKLLNAIEQYNEDWMMKAELITDADGNKMVRINHSDFYMDVEPNENEEVTTVKPSVFMMMFNKEFKEFVDDLWAEEDEIRDVRGKHLIKRLAKTNNKVHDYYIKILEEELKKKKWS